jgi:hypothetical protein
MKAAQVSGKMLGDQDVSVTIVGSEGARER